jgi:hypothetical protein
MQNVRETRKNPLIFSLEINSATAVNPQQTLNKFKQRWVRGWSSIIDQASAT